MMIYTYPSHSCLAHRAVLVDNSLAVHSGGAVPAEREFTRARGWDMFLWCWNQFSFKNFNAIILQFSTCVLLYIVVIYSYMKGWKSHSRSAAFCFKTTFTYFIILLLFFT